jgi:ubiquinone/menaquinone biosynthesis C-methylase UbiE
MIEDYIRMITFHSVLDVGAGQGQVLRWLKSRQDDLKCCGLEISQIAIKKSMAAPGSPSMVQGMAQSIPFADSLFDLVVCTDVLEHIPHEDSMKVIKELRRVSRQYLLLDVHTSGAAEDSMIRRSKFRMRTLHINRKKKLWWVQLFRSCGLTVLRSTPDTEGQQSFVFLCTQQRAPNHYLVS